jgi:hypothetical protein
MSMLVLLGPQRFEPTVRDAFDLLGVHGPIAVVTAGWQERESEDDELRAHLGCEVTDLLLYRRYDRVLARDRELGAALRRRQEQLVERQELYRLRLGFALEAARELMRRASGGAPLSEQRRAAIRALRTIDREHLRGMRLAHAEFEAQWRPLERDSVRREREELGAILERSTALALAGGHVGVLLTRLRLFGVAALLGERPVVAWSAGAMAAVERVVLFHDFPPQGAGDPEILDAGLGLCRGVVALPHARRRLRLDDPVRVALFARRFAPAACVVLDGPARLTWDGRRLSAGPATRALGSGGRIRQMAGA